MKKKLLLPLIALPLMVGVIGLSNKPITMVKAEDESSLVEEFVEKEYIYYNEENHNDYCILTLTSETDFKLVIYVDNELQGELFGTYSLNGSICWLYLGDEIMKVNLSSDGTFREAEYVYDHDEEEYDFDSIFDEIADEIYYEWNDFKDTILLPLLTSITIADILGIIVASIVTLRNWKINKKTKENNDNVVSNGEKVVEQVANQGSAISNFLTMSEDYSAKIQVLLEQLNDLHNELTEKMALLSDKTERMLEIKVITKSLLDIIGTIVAQNPTLVSNGTAEEVQKLINKLNELD